MPEEAAVFRRDGRVDKRRRQPGGRHPGRPRAVDASRFVQQFAAPIDDGRRLRFAQIEKSGRDWTQPDICADDQQHDETRCPDDRAAAHRITSTVSVDVRPEISGAYISSARVGATTNVPAVVARTMYENS